ncbi:CDP-glycerol glycerophosphotransferase family protein [Desulfobaculum bizertense]|uniref:CDP-glycerol glycerophosphotransferase, TagB/SpsB family n=1 Tax=Desulfobaculum bizertense DSM 18034 TaxID=1121442 RepID=A0A1T4VYY1_9BACT|nr:CDP-glycerol glycerophosphotransferase family protein [Desulfobaculum bizertense]SKA70224.1 CDP-glycerol glycerophosphotransferase, TagB/SpsB family [Desulfobaculum bizertense DSM 18034]
MTLYKIKKAFQVLYLVFNFFCKKKITLFCNEHTNDIFQNLQLVYQSTSRLHPCLFISINRRSLLSAVKFAWVLSRAKTVVIDASNSFLSSITLSPHTTVVQLWHGGGAFKGVGFNAPPVLTESEIKRIHRLHGYYDYAIATSSSPFILDTYAKSFNLSQDRVLPLGSPRTDILLKDKGQRRKLLREKYKISENSIVILYAPTFRTNLKREFPVFLDKKELVRHLPSNYTLFYRLHPSSISEGISQPTQNNWTEEEYLTCILAADILITDYSSIIFDFSVTQKPIFFFIPKENYNRKLTTTPEELLPDHVFRNEKKLAQTILTCEKHSSASKQLYQKHMGACDGFSTLKISHFLDFLITANNNLNKTLCNGTNYNNRK